MMYIKGKKWMNKEGKTILEGITWKEAMQFILLSLQNKLPPNISKEVMDEFELLGEYIEKAPIAVGAKDKLSRFSISEKGGKIDDEN